MKKDNFEITIALSKTKILLLTFVGLGFVLAGFWLWTIAGSQTRYDPLFAKLTSVSCIVFFGIGFVYGLIKLFDSKPGLRINQMGIFDNSSMVGGQLIQWDDIEGFEIQKVKNTKFLLIFVTNTDFYIDNAQKFKRFIMKMNFKMYRTPLSISSNSLQCDFEYLVDLIQENKIKYTGNS